MNKIIPLVIVVIIAVGGYFGYKYYRGSAPAPAAPAATAPAAPAAPAAAATALPEAVAAQLKTGIETAVAAIPNITPEQKTKVTDCAVKAVTGSIKAEDIAKAATDPSVLQTAMAGMANAMKPCLTEAGLPAQ